MEQTAKYSIFSFSINNIQVLKKNVNPIPFLLLDCDGLRFMAILFMVFSVENGACFAGSLDPLPIEKYVVT